MNILERLAAKYPLAIVTGRPRKPDCETALKVFGLSKLFKVVVCMEDAPVKPDPAPVRKCAFGIGVWGLDAHVENGPGPVTNNHKTANNSRKKQIDQWHVASDIVIDSIRFR